MSENKSNRTWLLLIVAWAAMACTQVITFSYGMMLPSIMKEFGVGYDVVGLVGSVAGICSVLVTIPIALLANKFNVKYAVPIIIGMVAIGIGIFGFATGIPMLFVGKIIAAIFVNGISTSLTIFKMQALPMEKLGTANGIENFVGPIGQVIATLVMAQILVLVGGWRNVHIIIFAIMIVLSVIWLVSFKDNKKVDDSIAKEKVSANDGLTEHPLKKAIKEKTFWLLAIAWPGTTIIWIGMFYYWPSFAMATHNLTAPQAGLVLSFIPIFSAIASLTSPILAKKLGYDKPLIWPWGFILPITYFLMLQTGNIVLLCIFSAITGYGCYCFVPLAFTTMYKLGHHPKVVSMGVAMVFTGVAVGSAVGSGVVGGLITAFGGDIYKALAICCLTPVIFGILTLFIPERGRKWLEKVQAAAKANVK